MEEINHSTSLRINGERSRTIKNLNKVAERIKKAIKNKEKIILYGDADLDGVASVIILKESIKNLNGEVSSVYFPDREVEGYGISETGLNYLKKFSPGLLIAVDCGIGNFKEVKLAKKFGFEVIVIDHHEILDKLPEAKIIVDPKQKGDKYHFKELATVGIIYKLSEFLFKDKMTENLRRNFLELTAIATLADMMPLKYDNEFFVKEGFKSLENSWRPAIQALLKTIELNHWLSPAKRGEEGDEAGPQRPLNLSQKVSKIISLLNVRDIAPQHAPGGTPASFKLLTISSLEESKKLIEGLLEKSFQRKEIMEKILNMVEERISVKEEPIIFEGDENFEFTLISSIASQLCQKYQKPTFIFKKLEKESQGTVRTPAGIDSVALMKKCKKYPITYGGHPQASGFRIKNEKLEEFKGCLIKNL